MSRIKKRFFILLVLAVAALSLMTVQHARKNGFSPDFFAYPFNVLNKASSDFSTRLGEQQNAVEENRRLKKELNELNIEKQQCRETLQENLRLREIVGLKEQRKDYLTSARVISRGYNTMINTVIIDKGSSSGVQKDMAVITSKGLAGKIYSISPEYATVLLVKDPNFSVAVRLQNSRREGVLSGTGYPYCVLKYVPPEETVDVGEVILTSGLDGLFPPGLAVGVVGSIKKDKVEFFQDIKITPFQSDSKMEEVVILKK